jgi:phospholipid/cholesterol/gamma-HCH transport system substrate-binding protein
MSFSKEFKVGLLAVVSITILYLGFNFLRGIDFFSSTNQYFAVYDEIDGLNVSNNVILNGFVVGRVSNMSLMPHRQNRILVQLDVDEKIVLDNNSVAVLKSSDVLGTKVIELIVETPLQQPLSSGDTLNSEIDRGIASRLMERAGPITDELGITLNNINSIIQTFADNNERINNSLINMEQATVNVNRLLNESRAQLNLVANDLSLALREVPSVMIKTGQLADSIQSLNFSETMAKTQQALESLNTALAKIDEGQGTLGQLINNDSVYENLNRAAEDLDRLLIDIRENPSRYVHFSLFGRRN